MARRPQSHACLRRLAECVAVTRLQPALCAASLTTLAFIATNSNSVLANGDLGLQQVPNPCACRLSRFCRTHATRGNQVLLAVLVAGVLIRLGLAALGVTALDFDAFSVVGFFLFWHCVLLL